MQIMGRHQTKPARVIRGGKVGKEDRLDMVQRSLGRLRKHRLLGGDWNAVCGERYAINGLKQEGRPD